jgi:hypothetical protein
MLSSDLELKVVTTGFGTTALNFGTLRVCRVPEHSRISSEYEVV